MPHKTTVTFSDEVYIRLRALAARGQRTLSDVVEEVLADALIDQEPREFTSIGIGSADVDDLGVNAEKYLAEDLR